MLKASLILVVVFAAFMCFVYQDQNNRLKKINHQGTPTPVCMGILFVLTLIKIFLAPCFKGYEVDMNTYTAWMQRAAEGLNGFYADGYFCDYPPLYIVMTGLFGWIRNLFGGGEYLTKLFVKMPGIIAEGLIGYELLRYYSKCYPKSQQIGFTVLVALLPSFLITGCYWGQTDSIFCYLMLLTFRFLLEDHLTLCALFFTLSALTKPQSFLFAPLIAVYFAKSDAMIFVFPKRNKQNISRERRQEIRQNKALEHKKKKAEEQEPKGKYKSLEFHIFLTIVTLGLYSIYWMYWLVKETRSLERKENKNLAEFLCCLLIPVYQLYWWYTRANVVHQRCKARYRINTGSGFTYFLCSLCGLNIVNMISMQRSLDILNLGIRPQEEESIESTGDLFIAKQPVGTKLPKAVKVLWNLVVTFVFALVIMSISMMPFRNGVPDLPFLIEKYTETFSSYPYASLNTFNLFGLLGGNMVDITTPFLFLTYQTWGTILMAVCVLSGILLAIFNKDKKNLFLIFGTYLFAIVMLGSKMHERYWYFVPVLFFVHFIVSGKRKYFGIASALTLSYFLNLLFALDYLSGVQDPFNRMLFVCFTVANLAILVYLIWDVFGTVFAEYRKKEKILVKYSQKFTWKSAVALLMVMLVFGGSAYYRLGSNKNTPQTYARVSAGDSVTFQFAEPKTLSEIRYFSGYGLKKYKLRCTGPGFNEYLSGGQEKSPYVFSWQQEKTGNRLVNAVVLEVLQAGSDAVTEWGEFAFLDESGTYIPYTVISPLGVENTAFNDEPYVVPEVPSFENSFYFDEIYHGRTAYEYVNGLSIYETTHPPLGKLLMTIGIGLFGWNMLGVRFMGVLFGLLMIPLFYQLSRRLFKYNWIALLTTVIFSFDFMHLSHSRIASIDSFMVFFILAAFTFMVEFLKEYEEKGLSLKAKVFLGLSGAMFGCGAAVKWAAIYAGLGLCAVYIYGIVIRFKKTKKSEEIKKLILWSLGLYALLPFAIYYFSYIPYFACFNQSLTLENFIGAQKHMYSYHSGLTATHPYSAAWYDWIIDLRPLWMHQGVLLADGSRETIATMNNPILIWGGLAAVIYTLVWCIREKKLPLCAFVIFAGYFSQMLPWMFVSRVTFTYHYFPMLAFLALAMGFYWKNGVADKGKRVFVPVGVCVIAVALFFLYYPVLTGVVAPQNYIDMLKIMPNWTF